MGIVKVRAVCVVCASLNVASFVRLTFPSLSCVSSLSLGLWFKISCGRRTSRRESIGIVLPWSSRIVSLRYSIAWTYRFMKRVATLTSTLSLSATMNGTRYVMFPKRIRKKISSSNHKGLPLASQSVGTTASFVTSLSYPSFSASRRTRFIPEPVSNTAVVQRDPLLRLTLQVRQHEYETDPTPRVQRTLTWDRKANE